MNEEGQTKTRWRDSPAAWIGAIASLLGVIVAVVAIVVSAQSDGGDDSDGAAAPNTPSAGARQEPEIAIDKVGLSEPGPPPEYRFSGSSSVATVIDKIHVVAWPRGEPTEWIASGRAKVDDDGKWSARLTSEVLAQPFVTRVVVVGGFLARPQNAGPNSLCRAARTDGPSDELVCRSKEATADVVVDPATLEDGEVVRPGG